MDVSELLDGTEPIEVELAGKTVVCEVYTSGWMARATLDQLAEIEPLNEDAGNIRTRLDEIAAELQHEVPDDRRPALELELSQLRPKHLKVAARLACAVVPLIVKDATIDGEPFLYNGRPFSECASSLPAFFLMAVMAKAGDVEKNPSERGLSESGEAPVALPEIDQTASISA